MIITSLEECQLSSNVEQMGDAIFIVRGLVDLSFPLGVTLRPSFGRYERSFQESIVNFIASKVGEDEFLRPGRRAQRFDGGVWIMAFDGQADSAEV